MTAILFLGLLLGLQHALEADHLAAVASLSTRTDGVRGAVRQGAAWGMGHTLTLFVFGGIMLLVDQALPPWAAHALEFAVGLMLVLLGADVLRRAWRQRVHFHAHSHQGDLAHESDPHQHGHQDRHLNELVHHGV